MGGPRGPSGRLRRHSLSAGAPRRERPLPSRACLRVDEDLAPALGLLSHDPDARQGLEACCVPCARRRPFPPSPSTTPRSRQTIGRALAGKTDYDAATLQLLYAANRFEIAGEIRGALERGETVLCDRYTASGIAYGGATGVDTEWLERVRAPLPEADVTILLDISPSEAEKRKPANRDTFERNKSLLTMARMGYLQMAGRRGWTKLDGTLPSGVITARIRERIEAAEEAAGTTPTTEDRS